MPERAARPPSLAGRCAYQDQRSSRIAPEQAAAVELAGGNTQDCRLSTRGRVNHGIRRMDTTEAAPLRMVVSGLVVEKRFPQ